MNDKTPMRPEDGRTGMPVAVIGLGSMGMGVARSLLRAGLPVSGYDVRPEACRRFEDFGGVAASSPGEVGRGCRAVVILVVNAEQTEEAIFGAGGLAESMEPGSVIVTSATVPPAFAAGLGQRIESAGLYNIDEPVSGGNAEPRWLAVRMATRFLHSYTVQ